MVLSRNDVWASTEEGFVGLPTTNGGWRLYFMFDLVCLQNKQYVLLAPAIAGPPLVVCNYIWGRDDTTWVVPVQDKDIIIRVQTIILERCKQRH